MDVGELLAGLDIEPGPDLEHRLVSFVRRMQEDGSLEPAEDEIIELRTQIDELKAANDRLEQTVNELRARIAPEPINNTYTIEQFMLALATKLGRTYGWRTDYALATEHTPGCQLVKTDDIQRWQKEKRVPAWAFAQIDILEFRVRLGRACPEWTADEVQYLIHRYTADPRQSNFSLATQCMSQFGRDITEEAIKGAIYRLGRQGRLPQHRSR